MTEGKIKVIYCMGSGRSGSTLLNIILSNHSKIFGAGEINSIQRINQEKFNCSCGNRFVECDFWGGVMDKWKKAEQKETPAETISKIHGIDNFKSPIAWIKYLLNYPFQSRFFKNYLESTYNFYKAMIEESGRPVIMDISKNPLRALVLNAHPKIDLRLIHLVRDGRGVAWSINKYDKTDIRQKPVWRAALFWTVINLQANFVRKRVKDSGLVLYEDLVKFPEKTINSIAQIADVDPTSIIHSLKGNLAQEESHIMAGNKLRRQRNITLKLDTKWKENLSQEQINSFMKIAGSTMASYGYTKGNP